MKKFLGVLVVLAVTSPALAGNVQMAIQGPAQVSWNDATGVMTVGLTFVIAGGHTDAVTAFGSEMYLTGANGATFTPDTGLYGKSAATMVSAAGAAGYAWSSFDQSVISGADPKAPGSGGVIFDHNSLTPGAVAINSVAAGAVTAVYEFDYTGNSSAFTQVYAWVVSDNQAGPYDAGNSTSWAYINSNTDAGAVWVTDEGINLAPTPEPASLSLLALGLSGLLLRRFRRADQ